MCCLWVLSHRGWASIPALVACCCVLRWRYTFGSAPGIGKMRFQVQLQQELNANRLTWQCEPALRPISRLMVLGLRPKERMLCFCCSPTSAIAWRSDYLSCSWVGLLMQVAILEGVSLKSYEEYLWRRGKKPGYAGVSPLAGKNDPFGLNEKPGSRPTMKLKSEGFEN